MKNEFDYMNYPIVNSMEDLYPLVNQCQTEKERIIFWTSEKYMEGPIENTILDSSCLFEKEKRKNLIIYEIRIDENAEMFQEEDSWLISRATICADIFGGEIDDYINVVKRKK